MSTPIKTAGMKREDWSQTADKAKEAACSVGDKMSEAGSSIGAVASHAASAVGAMACDVGKMASQAGCDVSKKAEEMLGTASHAISSTVRESSEYLGEAGFSGVTKDLAKLVRQNPIPSVCIAIGLGWLLARNLRN